MRPLSGGWFGAVGPEGEAVPTGDQIREALVHQQRADAVRRRNEASWAALWQDRSVPVGHRCGGTMRRRKGSDTNMATFRTSGPTAWRFDGDEGTRMVAVDGRVALRTASGAVHHYAATGPGRAPHVAHDLDRFVWDRPRGPESLAEVVGTETVDGRAVLRVQWQRTDRDLDGTLVVDADTGVILAASSGDGQRSEVIDGFHVAPDEPPLRDDPLLQAEPSGEPLGHVVVHLLTEPSREMLTTWTVRVAGLPEVSARAPRFESPEEAVAWARTHAVSASLYLEHDHHRIFGPGEPADRPVDLSAWLASWRA